VPHDEETARWQNATSRAAETIEPMMSDSVNNVTRWESQASRLPNMLILGAAKCGTSSLYKYLDQHPDVFMSPFKEPQFFIWEGRAYDIQGPGVQQVAKSVVTDLASYQELFSGAKHERIRGEGSTGYLHTPGVPERIRARVPNARLIAILRNPIDRAYSAFVHAQREGFEPLSNFSEALEQEQRRLEEGWIGLTLYTTIGMYASQLEGYLAHFPREQLRVYLFDDLVRNPLALARDAFRYLGVDDSFEPDVSLHENRGRAVRSVALRHLANVVRTSRIGRRVPSGPFRAFLRTVNERPIEPLDDSDRQRLARAFERDLERLSQLLGRDLSPWLDARALVTENDGTDLGVHPCP
jgi:hypothetical protein